MPSIIGSSPHARGAPRHAERAVVVRGIIPACAGSTRPRQARSRRCRNHPRIRGEHATMAWSPAAWRGSSPHARGAPGQRGDVGRCEGIIPACAGSTLMVGSCMSTSRDHPRMRGEHASGHALCGSAVGSSPHARGARRADRVISSKLGIIPACAGSTRLFAACRHAPRDHPRMRGEHLSPRRLTWSI